jgi:hypothetical protein
MIIVRPALLLVVITLAACSRSSTPQPPATEPAAHGGHAAGLPGASRTTLLGNLGRFSRPITTTSTEAQQFFDEGLTLLYGFNHAESFRSFARAAELDPKAPMPHWGLALALGTNINDPAPAERMKQAYAHLAEAQSRSANGSSVEQALIAALAKRYAAEPAGDQLPREQSYSDAMGEAATAFPDDPDVATLYAESLMNLRPWKLYAADGTPAPGTDVIVSTLERVMAAHPDHPGANHYFIHAVEASRTPSRATDQAKRLESLVPGAGHLVHMPSHIYMRTGAYAASAQSNAEAARVDEAYIKATSAQGMYPVMYYGHNLQFESAAAMFAGNFAQARDAAKRTVALVEPIVGESPMLEPFAMQEAFVLLRFGRWEDALATRAPNPAQLVQTALYHYVRGAAYAGLGRVNDAVKEEQALAEAARKVPADLMTSTPNTGQSLLVVAMENLAGRIAEGRGDREAAIAAYTRGVAAEDRLSYNEPPDWLLPVRERLGGALLEAGRPAESEKVFRADLERNVGNPRSLYGLWMSLDARKDAGAPDARKAFDEAWRAADVTLQADLLGTGR